MATTQRMVLEGATTGTVVSESFSVVKPAERYLEFGRQTRFTAKTIKAQARGFTQWWAYLDELEIAGCIPNQRLRPVFAAVRYDDFDATVESQPTKRSFCTTRALAESHGTSKIRGSCRP